MYPSFPFSAQATRRLHGRRLAICALALTLCTAFPAMAAPKQPKAPGVVEILCPPQEKPEKAEKPAKGAKAEKPAKGEKKAKGAKGEKKAAKTDDNKEAKQTATLAKMLKAIHAGGDINATDKNGQTALMYAASLGNRPAVCWLVAKGADVTLASKSGKRAADIARDSRSRELLEACAREKEPLSPEERYYYTGVLQLNNPHALAGVISNPWSLSLTECANRLRAGANPKSMVGGICCFRGQYSAERLAYIARQGYDMSGLQKDGLLDTNDLANMPAETVRLLLALGLKPDMQGATQEQQFLYAQKSGDTAHARKMIEQNAELEKRADWHTKMPEPTAEQLSTAIARKDTALVRALLAAGAPTSGENKTPPLHQAISMNYRFMGDETFTLALIDAGGLLDIDMRQGQMGFARHKEQELMTPPVSPPLSLPGDEFGNTAEIVDALIAAGADVEAKDEERTPLVFALQRLTRAVAINSISSQQIPYDAYAAIIQSLIKAKASVPKDALLHLPMGLRYGVAPEACIAVAEALLKAGADPKATNEEGRTSLMTAGSYSPALAKKLLKAGANPKAQTKDGWTALHSAQTPEVAALLIKAGADVNAATAFKERGTPLQNVLKMSDSPQLAEHVALLLEAKANAPEEGVRNLAARSPRVVSFAAFEATAKKLIEAGVDPNNGWEGNYPVQNMLAIGAKVDAFPGGADELLAQRPQDAEALVKAGANINAQDKEGNTPLMTAVRNKDVHRIQSLLKLGAKLDVPDKKGDTPLKLAQNDMRTLLVLARADAKLPLSVETLNKALELCSDTQLSVDDCKGVEKLVAQHLDKSSGVKVPADALLRLDGYKVMNSNHSDDLLAARVALHTAVARGLLDAGADPKVKGPQGRTALMSTCFCEPEITKRLLDAGADAKAQTPDGLTALHLVRTPQAMEMLLKAGADLHGVAKAERSSLLSDEKAQLSCTPLLYHLAKMSWNDGEQLELLKAFIKAGAKVKGDGWDAIFEAGVRSSISKAMIPVLTAAGADPNARDAKGRTWLMLNPMFITAFDEGLGLDINAQDNEGMTALMHLALTLRPVIMDLYADYVRSFIRRGAKTDLRTKEGMTLYQLVEKKLGPGYVYQLKRAGVKE